jgi:aminopeptidase N
VSAYGLGRTRSDAQRFLEQAESILTFYSELFGPPPYDRINLAVIEGQLPGGHSPPGMVVLARRPAFVNRALRDDPTNFSDIPGFFLAHELAHQWWGHGVAGQNYRERWLSEGFAQYAAALWVRRSRGEEDFQGVLRRVGRWAIRMSSWGPISLGYRLGHVKNEPNAFRALVYDKAAYVLHMLHGLLGAETFGRALVEFQARFRFQKAGSDDLREAFEAASGQPLGPFFDHWIHGTGVPTLSFSHSAERADATHRTLVRIGARQLPAPLALELTVFHEGGRAVRRVILPPSGGSFAVDSPRPAIRVEINADRGALVKVEEK